MNILVTGSEGTIGKPLSAYLRSKGHSVSGVDLVHTANPQYMRADISDYAQIERAVSLFDPDVVFNLAAEFGRHNGQLYPQQLWGTNVVGMKNILNLQGKYGFKLVHASSSEVYGEGPWDTNILDEEITNRCALFHHNDYAMSKWVNEEQIRNNGGDTVVARFFNSYGPGEYYHPYRSVVCLFCYRALHGLPFTVYKGYHRVFMYTDDFIPSLAKCATAPPCTINIGGDEYRSVEELYEIVKEQVGKDFRSDVTFEDIDTHNTVSKRPNIERARRLLQHNPTISLEEGVVKTLDWMRGVYAINS